MLLRIGRGRFGKTYLHLECSSYGACLFVFEQRVCVRSAGVSGSALSRALGLGGRILFHQGSLFLDVFWVDCFVSTRIVFESRSMWTVFVGSLRGVAGPTILCLF